MSSDAQPGTGEDATTDSGSSTDQHVTGAEETGTFITDQAPTGNTPAHGSSNEVFNKAGGNRVDRDDPGTLHK
jgi:hypothetical protein